MTDVAAQMDSPARPLQQLRDDGGGRRLAVAAGDRNYSARAKLKEHLHFRGDDSAVCDSFGQVLVKRHQARGAENDIAVEVLKIAVAERKLCSERK